MIVQARQKKGSGNVIIENQIVDSVSLVAGVDAGSTETRVCLADSSDICIYRSEDVTAQLTALTTTYRIPSTFATVEVAREIAPQSENLEDNYDSNIIVVCNKAESPMLSRHRVIRGRKIQDAMGVTQRYMDSSTNKTDNMIFYMNVIDALGYAIMQKYSGRIPKEVRIYLTLSVRPKELNRICKKKMSDNFVGSFLFTWRSVEIRINIVDVDFTSEPEAEISGTKVVYDVRAANNIDAEENTRMADILDMSDCFIHIEGGGSSIGVEVLRDGDIIDACSATFQLGGNYMSQVFIDLYRENFGRVVTREAANNALITCRLRDGRNVLDVKNLVESCKDHVAMRIFESMLHEVIDTTTDLTMQDLEFVTLGGRLFMADDCGTTIGQYVETYIHQLSPNTEVYTLPENFIAQGNLVNGVTGEFGEKCAPTSGDATFQEPSIVEDVADCIDNSDDCAS